MNEDKKLKLIRMIREIQRTSKIRNEIVLSIDDYFCGDETQQNMITGMKSGKVLQSLLKEIQKKSMVHDLLIRFYDYEDALDDEDCWINSDTIFIITTAETNEITEWFSEWNPSTITTEIQYGDFANLPEIPEGYSLINLWWD